MPTIIFAELWSSSSESLSPTISTKPTITKPITNNVIPKIFYLYSFDFKNITEKIAVTITLPPLTFKKFIIIYISLIIF